MSNLNSTLEDADRVGFVGATKKHLAARQNLVGRMEPVAVDYRVVGRTLCKAVVGSASVCTCLW